MTHDPDRAVERIRKFIFALAAGGALVLLVWRGWSWAGGWVLGAAASALNFYWLRKVTNAVGEIEAKDRKAVLLGLRYVLLGAGGYVILKYTAISLPAALAGLFVPVAAVLFEILIELAYARS
jgi:hypothetical protein